MSTLVLSHLLHDIPAALRALGGRFLAFFDHIHQARLMAQRYHTLASLSDAELARRGLKREDIAHTVLAAGFRS
jgi:hypothetical protein